MTVTARAYQAGFAEMRRAMVNSQLRVSDVNDPAILAVFDAVAREDFVPAEWASVAYMDRSVPLDDGQRLAPPLTHGQMLVLAAPRAGERALVVSGTGYLAALVRALGLEVTEIAPSELANRRKGAGFDLVLIDGAAEMLPEKLANQLADGGRVVTGLIQRGVIRLAMGRRQGDGLAFTTLGEIDAAPLPAFAPPPRWSFEA